MRQTLRLCCVVIFVLKAAANGADSLQAGAATSNITPAIGREIIGGFVPFPSKHIHDDLYARCLVLDDGNNRMALVVCDLLGIHRVVSEEARQLIAGECGIPREYVMISATHTHSASSALGQDRLAPDQKPDEYQSFVARRIADAVIRAWNNRRPAEIAFGAVDAAEHVFNRRWRLQPGTMPPNPFGGTDLVKMNPQAGSPNLVEPAGPTDPSVSFLSVRGLDGSPIALFSAYSLHYVGGEESGHVSADYYSYYCEHLKQLVTAAQKCDEDRPLFVALMANGTSGDINNINFRNPRGPKKPYEQMRFVAQDVANKVFAALPVLKYQSRIGLKAVYREPVVAWRRPTVEQRKWAEETISSGPKSPSDLSFIYAQRTMSLAGYPETTTIPLQTLQIGDVCIGTMPCEVLCEIGLDFKTRCPIQPAFMIELAHGYFGYLPTTRQLQLGGYETWIGTNRLEPAAADKLLSNLLEMTAELKQPWRKQTFVYKTVGDLKIQTDVYHFAGDKPRPVVVWLHGGALINGHREGIDNRLKKAMLDAGYIVVSFDYRLAPETQLPEIIADVEDAFRWIHEEGPTLFHADPTRIAVAGGSAGGYLTLTSGFRVKPRSKCLVSYWGYGDLVGSWFSDPSPHPAHNRIKPTREEAFSQISGPPVADARDRKGNGGTFYVFCRQTGGWPKAVSGWDPHQEPERFYPYMAVKNVTSDYPPTLMIHGEKDTDVPYEQSVMMAKEFQRHHVEHRLISVPGGEHGLADADKTLVDEAHAAAAEFIRSHLGTP